MLLELKDLKVLQELALLAAREAGGFIRSRVSEDVQIMGKQGGSSLASQVVTEVDFQSQDIILKHLTPSLAKFDLGLLTEESDDDASRFQKDYFWCVDPLDGTLPFTEQRAGYAVSIALVSCEGEAKIGVIYDAFYDVMYHATQGLGAYCQGNRLVLNELKTDRALSLYNDRSFVQTASYTELMKSFKEISSDMYSGKLNTHFTGGAVMNACWALDEAPACYVKLPKVKAGGGSLWDYAATACLYAEAGAHVSDVYGAPLDLNRKDSSFMNHRGVLFCSDSLLAEFLITQVLARVLGR